MYRVVFDTNTFVSAFGYGGTPDEAYRLAIRRKITLLTSPAIMQETTRILKNKLDWETERIEDVLKQIARVSEIVRPKKTLQIIEDCPDNRILECAVEGKANFIVSGDKHLLALKEFQKIPIVRAAELVSKLAKTTEVSIPARH